MERLLPAALLDEFSAAAAALADIGRAILAAGARGRIESELKPDRTFVTALDRAIETRLREEIGRLFPAHGIIGEEFGPANADAEFKWVLDPIDGTAQFIAGLPVYSTLIALARGGAPFLGLMDFPATGQRWLGVQGRRTTLNGAPCRVRDCASLSQAVISISSPDFFSAKERPASEALRGQARWRLYGGAALSYGLLAGGGTDMCFDAKFQVYDYAAFAPVIEGAGGIVSDWQGKPLTLQSGTQVLAAGSRALHDEALGVIAELR